MTRHFAAQHEARSDQMVALTRACIVALDAGDHFPGVPLVGGDGPTPIYVGLVYENAAAEFAAVGSPPIPPKSYPSAPLPEKRAKRDPREGFETGPDMQVLDGAWLVYLAWILFAGCVFGLVWWLTS